MNADDDGGSARLNFFPLFTKGRKRGRICKTYLLIFGGFSLILSSCREESSFYSYTKPNHKLRQSEMYGGRTILCNPIMVNANFVPSSTFLVMLAASITCFLCLVGMISPVVKGVLGDTKYPTCGGCMRRGQDVYSNCGGCMGSFTNKDSRRKNESKISSNY